MCPTCTGQVPLVPDGAGRVVCQSCGIAIDSTDSRVCGASTGAPDASAGETIPRPNLPFSPAFLAQYELVRFLGTGGMGAVYLMRQLDLGRMVAVKVVRGESLTPDISRRLLKEARVLASLNHANIVAIHGVGIDGAVPYTVCEFVEGETLARRLARRPALTLAQSLRIVIQMLDGLRAAHKKGIIHRDLKPGNVFLTERHKPKIGDFGLAKAENIPSGTSVGKILGTPAYMSPEQCRGHGSTTASDLYAAGLILFEMVTGQRPFPGPDLVDYLYQHVSSPSPMARSLKPELPAALETVIQTALQKDPSKRFKSAQEFRKALQEIYRGLTPSRDTTPNRSGPTDTPATDREPGSVLVDRYELVRVLGQGGMGQVWLAKDRARGGAQIAVKLLPPELWRDPEARANLIQEANLSLKLSHPNIVRLFNLEPGDPPFLVMEYVVGPSLAEELARRKTSGSGPLSPEEVCPLLDGLANALDHAHGRRVVHRDLKPSNVLLETSEQGDVTPKLVDFGIAAELASFRTRQTGIVPAGTLAYMSPEQLACQKLDARADVYSLGATIYQMLTLSPPFTGGDLSWAIQHAPVPVPDFLSASVTNVLVRVLSKKPSDRPDSARQLALEFRLALAGGKEVSLPPTVRIPVESDSLDGSLLQTQREPARTVSTESSQSRFGPLSSAFIASGITALVVLTLISGPRREVLPPAVQKPSPASRALPISSRSPRPGPAMASGPSGPGRPVAGPSRGGAQLLAVIAASPRSSGPASPTPIPMLTPSPVPSRIVQQSAKPPSTMTPAEVTTRAGSAVPLARPASAPSIADPRPASVPTVVWPVVAPKRFLTDEERKARDDSLMRGDSLYRGGDYEAALSSYRDAQDVDPDCAAVWRKVALCRTRQGNLASAIKAIERAHDLSPRDPVILNTFAFLLLKARHSRKALEVARRLVAIAGDNAEYWDTLGQIQKATGSKEDARKSYRKALAIDPEHSGAKQGLRSLESDVEQGSSGSGPRRNDEGGAP